MPASIICGFFGSASEVVKLIISVPPAMTRSDMPDMIVEAPKLTVEMPDPQKRSMVTPEARMSKPASSAAMRPRSRLCFPTWLDVPQMTSSTSAVLISLRSAMALRTVAPSCCGWISASAPLPILPMPRGVRQASMM